MQCFIYKGSRKADTYLYVTDDGNFSCIPDSLLRLLGRLEKVMDITLDENRQLANADVTVVIEQLDQQGYYLQMPPPAEKLFFSRLHLPERQC